MRRKRDGKKRQAHKCRVFWDRMIDRIHEHLEKGKNDLANECNHILGMLVAIPGVDVVEVVHGRWIDRTTVKGQVYCSECATIEKSTDSNYKSRYCPNCGAKMDGERKQA